MIEGTTKIWLRNFNPRSYAMNIIICMIIIVIIFMIFWRYIRPKWFIKMYKKQSQFEGFKYSHLTNQEQEQDITQPVSNTHTNCHMLFYGSSASGKTSFLKHYLTQIQRSYVVFGRDEKEFPASNFVPLLQLEKIGIESLANKTVIQDDAGAYKSLKTKVEDLLRFGRHRGIVVIYLAHFAKDVLPKVKGNCFKIFITINNPNNFFESIVQTYSINDPSFLLRWKYFRDQLEFGIIEFETRSQKNKV